MSDKSTLEQDIETVTDWFSSPSMKAYAALARVIEAARNWEFDGRDPAHENCRNGEQQLRAAHEAELRGFKAEVDRLTRELDDMIFERDQLLEVQKEAEARAERLKRERDEAEARYRFMVEKAADERLPAYREQGEQLLAITLRAEKAEARAERLRKELVDEKAGHAKTAKQFVDEHSLAGFLEKRIERLREALLAQKTGDMGDGSPCFCNWMPGEEPHYPPCGQARDALAEEPKP